MRKQTEHNNRKQVERRGRRAEIAAWLRQTMIAKGIGSTKWSLDAGLTRSTVSRALNPKSKTILSPQTLIHLAHAVDVQPPFEITLPQATKAGIPSAEILGCIILVALRKIAPDRDWSEKQIWPFAQALRYMLLELEADPRAQADLEMSERMMRTALRVLEP